MVSLQEVRAPDPLRKPRAALTSPGPADYTAKTRWTLKWCSLILYCHASRVYTEWGG